MHFLLVVLTWQEDQHLLEAIAAAKAADDSVKVK